MKKKALKILLVIFVLFVLLLISIVINTVNNNRIEQARLEQVRSLKVPANWQFVDQTDTLVRGTCLGTGSKCGYIQKEYTVQGGKEAALREGIATLERSGWRFKKTYRFKSHNEEAYEIISASAQQGNERLNLSVYKDKAVLYYTENHRTE